MALTNCIQEAHNPSVVRFRDNKSDVRPGCLIRTACQSNLLLLAIRLPGDVLGFFTAYLF